MSYTRCCVRAAAAAAVLLLLAGCANPLFPGHNAGREGMVVLVFSDPRSTTIVPPISLDIDHHIVSFSRAGFQTTTVTIAGNATQTDPVSLFTGTWDVTVGSRNEQGVLIGEGAAKVDVVARETASVSVTIRSLEGDGTLRITADVTGIDVPGSLLVSGTLERGADGAELPVVFVDGVSESEVLAGTYFLSLQVALESAGPDTIVAQYVNTVLIVTGQTTSATVAFRAAGGSVVAELVDEITRPFEITLDGVQPMLSSGASMNVTANTAAGVESYRWFLNGARTGVGAQSVTVGPGLQNGDHVLTVVAKRGSIFSSQETSFSVVGSMQFKTQARNVSARSGGGDPAEAHAAGFEDFDASVARSVTVAVHEYDLTDTFTAQASQTSTLAAHRIHAIGEAREGGPFYPIDTHSQEAASEFLVGFSLSERVSVALSGRLRGYFDTGGTNVGHSVAAALFNGAAPVFSAETSRDSEGFWEDLSISESLTLEPGEYVLELYARATADYLGSPDGSLIGGGGFAEYDIELLVIETL